MERLILEHGQDKGQKVHSFSLFLCIDIYTRMKVRAYDYKSKKQNRRDKNPEALLKKNPTRIGLMTVVGGYASEIP